MTPTTACEPRRREAAATAAPTAEFAFDDADFERVRRLIHRRAGISLGDGKQAMVYSRLSRRLRDTGHASFAGYLQWLEGSGGDGGGAAHGGEWQAFINALTTNLTAFFREEHHFEALADALAPRRDARVRLWCAAASTGEEPYSIAMTCAEAGARADIVASDIDTQVLAAAARGVYAGGARGLTPERLRRHFLRGTGPNAGCIRVRPELARQVTFRRHNLVDDALPPGEAPFDFVFCRNVMIYFDAATQRRVLERLHAALRPGGWLFVGHSENFADARALFRLRGKTVYERV